MVAFYSIDATFSNGLGRLVNDSPSKIANCCMKKVKIENKTCLALVAVKDIPQNTELRYPYNDYGLIEDLPWRKQKGNVLFYF